MALPAFAEAALHHGTPVVRAAIASAQQLARDGQIPPAAVEETARSTLPTSSTTLEPVLNATGVVVHTNIGRAPLSAAAVTALVAAAGYVDVEFDLSTGARARRG
ncbi:MAG: L-seryl-tRNA(Sec) selenium transferase, partial [Actinomycetota bacterium]|nr:L-seryl-tRNA(Sec) selenium transferase [Actinomycetota bacterium]